MHIRRCIREDEIFDILKACHDGLCGRHFTDRRSGHKVLQTGCDWATRLPKALWAYKTTWRNTTGYSLYQLLFGKEPIFPIEFEIQTLRTTQEVGLDLNEAQINRLQQINELDEIWLSTLQHTASIQKQRARWHDALIKNKVFREGDWALLYNSRFQDFPGKLQTRWPRPYEIQKVHDNGTITLTTIYGFGDTFKSNGHRVRLYRTPLTWESFYQQLQEDFDMQILAEEENSSSLLVH
eukprot:PITA_12550